MTEAHSPVAFGRYLITRRIARGGMAEIYRARFRATSEASLRWVAIKVMRPVVEQDGLRSALFEREARIVARLDHPHVVPVYEHGRELDRPYLAMEYVRGRDLSQLLRAGAPPAVDLVLYIGLCAAAGLGHAHRMADASGRPLRIVHRDVSPGNVMMGYDGSVKVLDFGVARIDETLGFRTQPGTLRGKFAYMSPEQARGEELDGRSDVFSLGVVLYELLTGVNCFRAPKPLTTLERVQADRPMQPSRANAQVPNAVDRILARCLAKDRARRFMDGAALHDALGDYLETRRFDGPRAVAAHLASVFARERAEEEEALAREEEEVARLDVVEFAKVRDDVRLDAANVAVSRDDFADEKSLQSVVRARLHDEPQDVFASDGPELVGALGEDETVTEASPGLAARADSVTVPSSSILSVTVSQRAEANATILGDAEDTHAYSETKAPRPRAWAGGAALLAAVLAPLLMLRTLGRRSWLYAGVAAICAGVLAAFGARWLVGRNHPPTPISLERAQDAGPKPSPSPEPPPPPKVRAGFLNVGARPWAEIEIDGKPWPHRTPQAGIELPPGRHVIKLKNPETQITRTVEVQIKPGAYETVMMDLRRR